VIVTVCWSRVSLMDHTTLNPGKTIAAEKYFQKIEGMHQTSQRLRPCLVNKEEPIFLHNNAWRHITLSMLKKLNVISYEALSIYLTADLSPTD
ncbi:hypothetical protein Angca_002880, partial [Angiostrongylus cantonensis]